ncbi:MAG: cohesin domain-containing protein [Oscillospiraceae bacterium]|nr:cohesin domain-containing protein [Oscillospiraceae bacterium]
MRKTIGILIVTILVLLISVTPIFATTAFNVAVSAASATVEQGEDVQVTVSLKDFTPKQTGINAIYAKINYDKSVFDTLSVDDLTTSNGWDTPTFNPENGAFVVDNNAFMSTAHDLLTINFHVKNTATVGNTVITIGDVDASDGVSDIYTADQSVTVAIAQSTNPAILTQQSGTATNTSDEQSTNYTALYVVIGLLVLVIIVLVVDLVFVNKRRNNKNNENRENITKEKNNNNKTSSDKEKNDSDEK